MLCARSREKEEEPERMIWRRHVEQRGVCVGWCVANTEKDLARLFQTKVLVYLCLRCMCVRLRV